MIEAIIRAWSIPELRKRIAFVLGMMAVFAVGAHIPVPGIDHSVIQNMLRNGGGGILQLIDAFGGGALRRMSIFAMGNRAVYQRLHHYADDDDRTAATRCALQRGRIGTQADR